MKIELTKILKRAWYILMDYRTLWIFGVLLALTAGGGGAFNMARSGGGRSSQPSSSQGGNGSFPPDINGLPSIDGIIEDIGVAPETINLLIGVGIGLICLVLFISLFFAIIRYVSETAMIRMVDNYESSEEKVGFRKGWRLGWSRSAWRLFIINLLVNLPSIFILAFLIATGVVVFILFTTGNTTVAITSLVITIGVIFLLGFLVFIIQTLLKVLRHFFWRACVVENVGVIQSIKLGFGVVRQNLKEVALLWLIMIGLGIAYSLAYIFILLLIFPVILLVGMAGFLISILPGLLVSGVSALFIQSPWNWVTGGVLLLIIFLFFLSLPGLLVNGWKQTFRSSVWTLAYRELRDAENSQ
jgi:hypothetical protein